MSSFATPIDGDVKLERDSRPSNAIPGTPDIPGTPAYDSTETGTIPYNARDGYLWVVPPEPAQLGVQPFNPRGDYFVLPPWGPAYLASTSDPYYTLGFVRHTNPNYLTIKYFHGDTYQYILHHPATPVTPGTPGTPDTSSWDAIGVFAQPLVFESQQIGSISFYPDPASVGVAVGFVRNPSWGPGLVEQSPGVFALPTAQWFDPTTLPYAIYFNRGKFSIIEYGVMVTPFPLDSFVDGDRFTLDLNNPKVPQTSPVGGYQVPYSIRYLKNDTVFFTRHLEYLELYVIGTSAVVLAYAPGDHVLNMQVIAPVAVSATVLAPLRAYFPNRTRLEALTGHAMGLTKRLNSHGQLATLRGYGSTDANFVYSAGRMAALAAKSAGLVPAYNSSSGFLSSLFGFALSTPPRHITSAGQVAQLIAVGADKAQYGHSAGFLFPLVMGQAMPFLRLVLRDRVGAQSGLPVTLRLFALVNARGVISTLFTVRLGLFAKLASRLGISTAFEARALLYALLASRLGIGNTPLTLTGTDDLVDVWVVNTESSASTRYEQFDYDSFALIDGDYYGARTGGIYRLAGDVDDIFPIRASINFGKQDFGSTLEKRVPTVYLGVASSGLMVLKVLAEDAEYLYTARDDSPLLQTQRFDLGKGLRANFYEFEIYNGAGDDFDLASIEFVAVSLSRRI